MLQQALDNYATSIQTLQRLANEESLATGNSADLDVEENITPAAASPYPALLIRNKSRIFSIPKGLGVPPQLRHLEILGASKARKTGSETTWSDSGSTYFDGDDRHLDVSVASRGHL
jgi:hypothetical protein